MTTDARVFNETDSSNNAPMSLSEIARTQELALKRPRTSLGEDAAETLREYILRGRLVPGLAINERDLASALGISRTPLREAMRILSQEGLIDYSQTRRPKVASPSLSEIVQNLRVMSVLEGLAGELACINASDAQITLVHELNRKMQEGSGAMDPLDFFKTDMEFHSVIVTASGNLPLADTHKQYNARLWRARFLSSQRKSGRHDTLSQHNDIATSLGARNSIATGNAMRAHLASTIANVTALYTSREQDASRPEPTETALPRTKE